jgi:hypothetical protein
MADLTLPIMGPSGGASYRLVGLRCWARRDNLSPYGNAPEPWSPYATACGANAATDFGLCAHHLAAIFPQARSAAS